MLFPLDEMLVLRGPPSPQPPSTILKHYVMTGTHLGGERQCEDSLNLLKPERWTVQGAIRPLRLQVIQYRKANA